jgi:hypothetical protein
MDGPVFDALSRAVAHARSRRDVVRLLQGIVLGGPLVLVGRTETAAKKKRKKKHKRRRKHDAVPPQPVATVPPASPVPPAPVSCGGVVCPAGELCCPDGRCGPRCCQNGRACTVTCCGPTGGDFCCPADRPVCICGGCWQAGSTQCDTPGHCCAPGLVCCGRDHCCDPVRNLVGEQCLVGCGGDPTSATCCLGGQSPRCCPDGVPG